MEVGLADHPLARTMVLESRVGVLVIVPSTRERSVACEALRCHFPSRLNTWARRNYLRLNHALKTNDV